MLVLLMMLIGCFFPKQTVNVIIHQPEFQPQMSAKIRGNPHFAVSICKSRLAMKLNKNKKCKKTQTSTGTKISCIHDLASVQKEYGKFEFRVRDNVVLCRYSK